MNDSSSSCSFCLNLRESRQLSEDLTHEAWARGLISNTCTTCQILVKCINIFKPDMLEGSSLDPECGVSLSIKGDGEIWVEKMPFKTSDLGDSISFHVNPVNENAKSIIHIGRNMRPIEPEPGMKSGFDMLRSCLETCLRDHVTCAEEQDLDFHPARLVHIDPSDPSGQTVRLVATKDHRPTTRYICLSYCWGEDPQLLTKLANLDQHSKQIPWRGLPRCQQDCITVAREFRVEYVWIDALCIVQDDRTDWGNHSQRMHVIYRNALFTVAVVASSTSSQPFLGPDTPHYRAEYAIHNIETSTGSSGNLQIQARHASAANDLGPDVETPLWSRAWTWQEQVFSRRILYYLDHKTMWKCYMSVNSEAGEEHPDDSWFTNDLFFGRPNSEKDWYLIVETYSGFRGLTYSTDRLPALSGMASHFAEICGGRYMAGLWAEGMPIGLAWASIVGVSPGIVGPPQLSNGIPSWSWASVGEHVEWKTFWPVDNKATRAKIATASLSDTDDSDIVLENRAELIDFDCMPSSSNLYGEVRQGSSVTLRSQTTPARMLVDVNGNSVIEREGCIPQKVYPDCRILGYDTVGRAPRTKLLHDQQTLRRATEDDFPKNESEKDSDDPETQEPCEGEVLCLLLYTNNKSGNDMSMSLILAPHPKYAPAYQRLGISYGCLKQTNNLKTDANSDADSVDEGEKYADWRQWYAGGEIRDVRIA